MTADEARDWIAGLQILGMRLGLERIRALLAALGDPQRAAPALHVVGTNGKSSTARLAAAALASQGTVVGAYLSPHIDDWTERVQLGGAPIDDDAFAEAATAVRAAAEGPALSPGDPVTQFEALTALAFWAFRRAGAGAMAIEAGLGGRWDATNVLQPEAAVVLTNVALEHTEFLGDTEAAIAAEKLAVCADGSDRLVVGPLSRRARAAVDAELARRGISAVRYGEGLRARDEGASVDRGDAPRPLRRAAAGACGGRSSATTSRWPSPGRSWSPAARSRSRRCGGRSPRVRMPGRLEVVPGRPPVVLDGAHNPAGVEALAAELAGPAGGRRPGRRGPLDPRLQGRRGHGRGPRRGGRPGGGHALVAPARGGARAPGGAGARRRGSRRSSVEEPAAALARAREEAGFAGVVVVAGSLYLLADLRPHALPGGREPPARLAPARKGDSPPERI